MRNLHTGRGSRTVGSASLQPRSGCGLARRCCGTRGCNPSLSGWTIAATSSSCRPSPSGRRRTCTGCGSSPGSRASRLPRRYREPGGGISTVDFARRPSGDDSRLFRTRGHAWRGPWALMTASGTPIGLLSLTAVRRPRERVDEPHRGYRAEVPDEGPSRITVERPDGAGADRCRGLPAGGGYVGRSSLQGGGSDRPPRPLHLLKKCDSEPSRLQSQ